MTTLFICLAIAGFLFVLWAIFKLSEPDTPAFKHVEFGPEGKHEYLEDFGYSLQRNQRWHPLRLTEEIVEAWATQWTTAEQQAFIEELCKHPEIADLLKVEVIHHEVRKINTLHGIDHE